MLGLLGSSSPSEANTWSQRPNWAADGTTATTQTNAPTVRRFEVAPFSPGSNNIAIGIGQVFLTGALRDRYDDALGLQLHYTYGVSELFGLHSIIGHSTHSDGEYSITTLLAGLRMNLAWFDRIIPHGTFGMGFFRPSHRLSDTASVSPILFGMHLGAGVDLQLTRQLFFGTTLTLHDIFGTTRQIPGVGPYDVGGTYLSLLLRTGFTF